MSRLIPVVVLIVAFTIFSVVHLALTPRDQVRGIPKSAWIVFVILVPVVGGVMWFAVGRVRAGESPRSARRGPIAPDDDPEFLGKLGREKAMEDRIEQLERELRDLDDDPPKG
jgi:hypothetical protein